MGGSALMIVSGYYGELTVTGDLTPRWICWFISMVFFLYIVYELLVGLSAATNSEADPNVKGKIQTAQIMTVISWCTYPIVYLFPMLGINALRQLSASRLAIVHPISSPSAVLESSSTRSRMQSRAKRVCCLSEFLHLTVFLFGTLRALFSLLLQECFETV